MGQIGKDSPGQLGVCSTQGRKLSSPVSLTQALLTANHTVDASSVHWCGPVVSPGKALFCFLVTTDVLDVTIQTARAK